MAKKRRSVRKASGARPPSGKGARSGVRHATARKAELLPKPRNRKPADNRRVSSNNKSDKGKKGRVKASPRKKSIPKSKLQQPIWKSPTKRAQQARSFAAKKGWLTRKHNQRVKALEELYVEREREFKKTRKKAKAQEKVIVKAQALLKEQGKEVQDVLKRAEKELEKDFDEKLDRIERLMKAQMDGRFDEVAYELAEEYDMEAREVYTEWAYNGWSD
jgi:hypothetical protein